MFKRHLPSVLSGICGCYIHIKIDRQTPRSIMDTHYPYFAAFDSQKKLQIKATQFLSYTIHSNAQKL